MCWRSGLALILSVGAAQADGLTFLWALPLQSGLHGFGGLSAIEMQDAQQAIVLSDRGQAFTLILERSSGTVDITPATQPKPHRDSEGLALAGGRMFFSYEGPAEITDQAGRSLPSHPDFASYHPNGSLEALAGAPDGTLYVLPERSGGESTPFPLYRYRDGAWDIIARLPRRDAFLPAGADVGPDGLLYILWRSLSPLGFRTRITRMDPDDPTAQAAPLLTTRPGRHDNLEGLSVWQAQSGAICLSMVSDNNFLSAQRSELVEYALTQSLAGGATCD